ncbi:MAG TPA: bifunctional glutamate N-acetyltransferase/amino-acid acetyltransferase ArgJ [Gemmatimonadales bacterium]|nr:bifunctional glutamate N-acetyltransferase/amino-acid acetyltransferase ArgJ [Gemmatimonadales bacterium]
MPALERLPDGSVTSPTGYNASAVAAGLKDGGQPDVGLLVSDASCAAAGVFTQNRVRAAPVLYDEALLNERPGRLRGVVMNARVANACTGERGLRAAEAMARAAEGALELPARTMLVLSTGVIGVQLPVERIERAVQRAAKSMSPAHGPEIARAIMTTDTRPKHLAVRVETNGGVVTVGGMAKGAGMIHPNMATMLGVLTTDAVVEVAPLRDLLRRVADRSFNAITIDGDTSTNDTVLMLANGASEVEVRRDLEGWKAFEDAVALVSRELALMIVQDGEGATRFVEIQVIGAATEPMARDLGRAIARSTLVKTALAGGDPNWGRVLAAAGAAGFPIVPERLQLAAQRRADAGGPDGEWLTLAQDGATADADEGAAHAIFTAPAIALRLDLGMGGAEATVWTCDLSEDYVRINAHYRS